MTTTPTRPTVDRALELEAVSIEADLEWRRVKATQFLRLIGSGERLQDAYKQLDTDSTLLGLEQRARLAQAQARAGWLLARFNGSTQEEDENE